MNRLALATIAFLFPSMSLGAAIELAGVNSGFSDGVQRVIGWQFTVGNSPVSIDELGVFDFDLDGLATSHEVGVWSLDQTLVVSATVPAGTTAVADGNFRYVDVQDTTLQANTEYVIGATWVAGGDEFVWDAEVLDAPGVSVDSFAVDSRLSIEATALARFAIGSSLVFPTGTTPGNPRQAFWGPNFTIVPEPSTLLLLATAFLGVSRRR